MDRVDKAIYVTDDSSSDACHCQECLNRKQILGNASSLERLGQFKPRGGEETNMHCVSGCLKQAASHNLEEVGGVWGWRGGGEMGKTGRGERSMKKVA